jgi:hypothetical protein
LYLINLILNLGRLTSKLFLHGVKIYRHNGNSSELIKLFTATNLITIFYEPALAPENISLQRQA